MEKIYEYLGNLFGQSVEVGSYIFWGIIGVVVLLIVAIIVVIALKTNKKEAKKDVSSSITLSSKEEEVKEEKIENTSLVQETSTVEEKTSVNKVKVASKEKPQTKENVTVTSTTTNKRFIGKFTISQEGLNYRYRLKASNGELLVVSEIYTSEESARKGIDTIKRNVDSAKIELVEDKHGLFSFRVMTKQGRCLATSANYKTKARALSASESFKKFVVTDKIENEETNDHFEVEEFNEEITPEANGKFKIVNQNENFIYQLYASNGRVIASSQQYKSSVSCKEGLEKFREVAYSGKFYIFKDKNGMFQFKLYNKQKRLVLAGEVYDAKERVVSAIESIKRFAKLAEVVDVQIEA